MVKRSSLNNKCDVVDMATVFMKAVNQNELFYAWS